MLFFQKRFWKILLVVAFAVLAPYIYLSCFAHPIADDYHYSFLGMKPDFWNEWKKQYTEWNGRYTSNLLVLLNPMAFHNLFLYKAASSIQILLSLLSIYYFFRSITDRSFSRLVTLDASVLLLLLYLFSMPSLAEGIYWYTGAVSYQTGICISLLYFGLLCNYFNAEITNTQYQVLS